MLATHAQCEVLRSVSINCVMTKLVLGLGKGTSKVCGIYYSRLTRLAMSSCIIANKLHHIIIASYMYKILKQYYKQQLSCNMSCKRRKNYWQQSPYIGKMSILDIGPVIFGDIDRQISWFQGKHLLANQTYCSACGTLGA